MVGSEHIDAGGRGFHGAPGRVIFRRNGRGLSRAAGASYLLGWGILQPIFGSTPT